MPGFPCKSSNTKTKVLGRLPDKGEELALENLNNICEEIKNIYDEGANVLIVSDGRVFSDLINVSDEDITNYHEELKRMNLNKYVSFVNLEDLMQEKNFDKLRYNLIDKYGMSLSEVKSEIKESVDTKNLYLGLTRFMIDDLTKYESNKKFIARCKNIALKMVQRSRAYDSLIKDKYPNHIRLSIHPHSTANNKFGINLIGTNDNWGTPWHNVAVKTKTGKFKLVKKKFAKHLELVYENNRPSYFKE